MMSALNLFFNKVRLNNLSILETLNCLTEISSHELIHQSSDVQDSPSTVQKNAFGLLTLRCFKISEEFWLV